MLTKQGQTIISVDLCPGLGQWRVQHIQDSEFIIGIHSYVVADDESYDQTSSHLEDKND